MTKTRKVANILGLGHSLDTFNGGFSIGVNDIYRFVSADVVVCIDHKQAFTPDRLAVIEKSTPSKFISHIAEWSTMDNFELIKLTGKRPTGFELIESDSYYAHNNSTYVACQVAARMGYEDIILHGVDFKGHSKLDSEDVIPHILERFKFMSEVYKTFDINLYVSSDYSRISEVLPVWES